MASSSSSLQSGHAHISQQEDGQLPFIPPLPNNPFSFLPKEPRNTVQISTWNLNGIGTVIKDSQGFIWDFAFRKYIEAEDPHLIVFTEVHKTGAEIESFPDLFDWWKSRYPYRYWAGKTGVISKLEPLKVTRGFPEGSKYDKVEAASRCITLEFASLYILAAYVPNSGDKFNHIHLRQAWNADFEPYLYSLDKKKPVIWCGDFNVVRASPVPPHNVVRASPVPPHNTSLDLSAPARAWGLAGGTHQSERDALERILTGEGNRVDDKREVRRGFKDVWRELKGPHESHSTGHMGKWRLDGFIISERILFQVRRCEIRNEVWDKLRKKGELCRNENEGRMSDHWPVWISFEMKEL